MELNQKNYSEFISELDDFKNLLIDKVKNKLPIYARNIKIQDLNFNMITVSFENIQLNTNYEQKIFIKDIFK